MKVYYGEKNVGDTLSPFILEYFTNHKSEKAQESDRGKLLMVGSFLDVVNNNDILLGVGSNKPNFRLTKKDNLRCMSVRGPLTKAQILDYSVPDIFGDPAVLLPLMYQPKHKIEKTKKIGTIPHYIDWPLFDGKEYINIAQPWKSLVDEILSCEQIISSTLHGIVIAEAYGIPATWAVYSNNIAGGSFKYQDYFLGTDRETQKPFKLLPPIENLSEIQNRIIEVLKQL